MRRIKIEIPITILTVILFALLALSGNLVYKSLSDIVSSVLIEARPNNKLILVKDITSNLNEVENTVKLYSLSDNNSYLNKYYELNNNLESAFSQLQAFAITDSLSRDRLDSLMVLAQQKQTIWKNILNLHLSKENEHEAFNTYFETLDTIMVVQDTIHFEASEKVGFMKRLFGKKPEPPKPIIVDRTVEKQALRQEIEGLEKEIIKRNKQITAQETAFMEKNVEVNEALENIISALETQERQNLLNKTREADTLANKTYERLALFALSFILLLLLVLFLFFRDLRKSRAYQQALKQAKTQAENLARTKELFVATVSHEMRTPVNAIFGLSEQLLQQQHEEKTQKDLSVIYESTKHLTELVNDTFDFTRIEKQSLQLKPSHFSLHNTLDKIKLYHQDSAKAKNIKLIVEKDIDPDLVLYGDEGRLRQILNNLVTNAIKFTDEGFVKLQVLAEINNENISLSFQVSDSGIGIAKNSQQRIFEDFVQLETDVNKKSGGTGLGLYIVKKLVDILEGKISLESEPGKGTTFYITIPFKKGDPEEIENTIKSYPSPAALKNKKVLIVDDEEFNRHLLKNILTKWNIDFDEAENGSEAIDLTQANNYALIFMDIRMPVMSGTDAAKKLKAENYPAKIIGLSANTNDSSSQKLRANGFDSYLEKPFSESSLYNTITETMHPENESSTNNEEAPIINVDLKELERMANGDTTFLKDMISLFMQTSSTSIESMERNLHKKKLPEIAELAHKLAAPVKYMNIKEVYKTVKEIQSMAENKSEIPVLETKLAQLKEEVKALNAQLEFILANKLN